MNMKKKKAPLCRRAHESGEETLFISANGYRGFVSHHQALYHSPDYTRLFILAGGPGTGKSSLMREVREAGRQMGATLTTVLCSSDPASLDGVILEKSGKRIAVLDGTAPHMRGTDCPGYIDELVNLGDCWDGEALAGRREEISALAEKKAEAYARAYRLLSVAGTADRALDEELRPCLLYDKMLRAVGREFRRLAVSFSPGEEMAYRTACSMRGFYRLPPEAGEVITVSDELGAGHFYLDALLSAMRSEGLYCYRRAPSCYDDEKTEELYLPENKLTYLVKKEKGNGPHINIQRFLDRGKIAERRTTLRLLLRRRDEMQTRAQEALAVAGEAHFALEKIYGEAMDFQKKEEMTRVLSARITSLLLP